MSQGNVTSFEHTGIVVTDLAAAVEFFNLLGLNCSEPFSADGDWVARILGLPAVRVQGVMVRTADESDALELATFHEPAAETDGPPAPPNRLGLRHIAFAVDDINAVVDRLSGAGWSLIGEIVDYQGMFLLCYVRGPEGLIVELAERRA